MQYKINGIISNISTVYIILSQLPLHLSCMYSNKHINGMTMLNVILTYLLDINSVPLKASPVINDRYVTTNRTTNLLFYDFS